MNLPSVATGPLHHFVAVGPGRVQNLEVQTVIPSLGPVGGPVLDDHGLVVGMVRTSFPDLGYVYAIHADEIRAALPDLKSGRSR